MHARTQPSVQMPCFHFDGAGNPVSMGGDDITIEILESGDIRIVTDPISGPNHMSAEGLLRTIAEIAGGLTQRVRRRLSKLTHKQHLELHRRG